MASIRVFKKRMNYLLGSVIDTAFFARAFNKDTSDEAVEKVVNAAVEAYDEAIREINRKDVDNIKSHIMTIEKNIDKKMEVLLKDL